MPSGKSRRVAARQAQLSGRSRRSRTRGPARVPSTRTIKPEQHRRPSVSQEEPQIEAAAVEEPRQVPQQQTLSPQSIARHSRTRARAVQALPIETYFSAEMRRIGVVVALVATILTILTFVLR